MVTYCPLSWPIVMHIYGANAPRRVLVPLAPIPRRFTIHFWPAML
jgi:hypothetical protein